MDYITYNTVARDLPDIYAHACGLRARAYISDRYNQESRYLDIIHI